MKLFADHQKLPSTKVRKPLAVSIATNLAERGHCFFPLGPIYRSRCPEEGLASQRITPMIVLKMLQEQGDEHLGNKEPSDLE